MRHLTRYLVAAVLIAVVGVVVGAWPRTELDVIAEPASLGPVAREIVAQSKLQAAATVDVATSVSGEVQALDVDEQAYVHAGDIIARIDPAPFEQALRDARTTLSYLEQDEDASPSRLADARRSIRDAERDLERTIVRSPVDGIVVVRNVSIGQIVSTSGASPLLYRIATDLQHLEINVEIPRDELAELRSGSDVLVTTDVRNGHERHGTVSRVALTTTVDIPNADLQWRPGTAVTATIVLERKDNVLRVPSDALTFSPPEESASIVDANGADLSQEGARVDREFELWRYQHGRLTPIAVRVGLSGEGWTEIDSGIEDGDQIATGVLARRVSMWSTIWFP